MILIEGVPYHPFVIRYTVGRKRFRIVRWSPARMFVCREVAAELSDRYAPSQVRITMVRAR